MHFQRPFCSLEAIKVYKPKEVSHLANLFYGIILAAITPNADYSSINSQYKEQRNIGQNLQKYKRKTNQCLILTNWKTSFSSM